MKKGIILIILAGLATTACTGAETVGISNPGPPAAPTLTIYSSTDYRGTLGSRLYAKHSITALLFYVGSEDYNTCRQLLDMDSEVVAKEELHGSPDLIVGTYDSAAAWNTSAQLKIGAVILNVSEPIFHQWETSDGQGILTTVPAGNYQLCLVDTVTKTPLANGEFSFPVSTGRSNWSVNQNPDSEASYENRHENHSLYLGPFSAAQ